MGHSGSSAACGADISARIERYDMTAAEDRADNRDHRYESGPRAAESLCMTS